MHALIALLKRPYMVVWHVTIEIMLVIIYLLEDEQELSLGMLIRINSVYPVVSSCFLLFLYFRFSGH